MSSKNLTEKKRQFSLTNLAVDNRTSIFLITFMIILFGVQSYNDMPKEQYPDASLSTVFVNTFYFGNSASDIESLITRPIEKELLSINGIKNVRATSIQDFSVIISEFQSDIDIKTAVAKIKDAVDMAKTELPDDLTSDPIIEEVAFSEIPFVTVNVSGDYPMHELRSIAKEIKEDIEDIREVSKVDMKGDQDREVRIDIDLIKMQSLKVSFNDIENAIKSENLTMSSGDLLVNDFRRSIRVIGQYENMSQIQNTIIKSENIRPIFLKDFATVNYGFEDRKSYARMDGLPVIALDVIKRRGSNMLNAAAKLKIKVKEMELSLPKGIKLQLFNDLSNHTLREVSNLENSIISGVILVILVLLFFLGLRNSLFVGLAIPLSMLTGILILHITGTTMNVVVLFSLILALGLLVDNAIVAVENIYRFTQNKHKGEDAAKYGAGEIAMPIIVSTATTLAAFLPLAFWPGMMGLFLKYMPITLIIVLTSSLFVALVIIPVFTSRFMKIDQKVTDHSIQRSRRNNFFKTIIGLFLIAILAHLAVKYISFLEGSSFWLRNLLGIIILMMLLNYFVLNKATFYFQEKILPAVEHSYDRFVRFALKGKWPLVFLVTTMFLLFFSGFLLVRNAPKVKLFPSADPLYINAFVELPMGSDINATNTIVQNLENKINKVITPYKKIVEAVLVQIGEDTSDPNSPPEPGVTPHKARITISFLPSEKREDISTVKILEELRKEIKSIPGANIFIAQNAAGPPTGKPISIEFKGKEIDSLLLISERCITYINNQSIQGIEKLVANASMGKPELKVNVDRIAARKYNLSTHAIAKALRTSVFGKEISKFKDGEEEYPIMIRLNDKSRYNISDLMNQKITFRNQHNGQISQVPISTVADIEYSTSYNAIHRLDGERLIELSSNVLEAYNANEVVANISDAMTRFDLPDGYSYNFGGEQVQQAEDMEFLSTAFLLAIFSIFVIIVAQFNSIISPFIIILTVFFSTIGVFLGYLASGDNIYIVFTGVGIISLAGIVVNNAIVLIDYINLKVKEKRKSIDGSDMMDLSKQAVKDAIIVGGTTRLRPVLLTAITTVLGLVPMALGINFNFFTLVSDLDPQYFVGGDSSAMWGPMAWTIIYGIIFATFLTLIVVPVMYWLAFNMKRRFSK